MKKLFLICLLFIPLCGFAQRPEEVSRSYKVEKIKSQYFTEDRVVKIFLPENFNPAESYPVIYTLDGDFLFDIVTSYVEQMTKGATESYNVIPKSIVVGVFHEDRGYETKPNFKNSQYLEGPAKLKSFLEEELIPFINKEYKTSGYNIVIGHSNTAHFAMNLLLQDTNPFAGILAMSLTYGNKDNILIDRLSNESDRAIYIGYGARDHDFNEFAERLNNEITSGQLSNPNLKVERFNASHLEMPVISLVSGIRYMFDKYKNFDNFAVESNKPDFSVKNYEEKYVNANKALYGIDVDLSDMDFYHLVMASVKAKNVDVFKDVVSYFEQKFEMALDNHTYFYMYRDLGEYESSRKFAYAMANSSDENDKKILYSNISSYIDLFTMNLDRPQEALEFLNAAISSCPQYELEFRYFLAKTAIENNIQPNNAKQDLKFCSDNFKENRHFTIDDLKKLDTK